MVDSLLNLLRQLRERLHLSLPQTITLFLVLMFVASLVCLILFGAIADELMDDAAMVAFDQELAQALHNRASEGWTSAFALITLFGSQVVFVLALIVGAYYAYKRHWLHLGVWTAALAGGQLLNFVLKAIFARPRPTFADPLVVEQFYSFPSGHAMLSMIAYGLLAYFVLEVVTRRRYKTLVIAAATVLIVMVGLSRLYLGVHFFSDVIAGFLAGAAWLFACLAAMTYIRQRNTLRENP